MTRILFVDDDQAILDGLKNVLHRYRKRWELEFVTSGKAALEALRARPFAVVISDMRMPGMDGVELLTRVREEHPEIVRIIFSGQADREAVMRCLPLAHQLLAKPCEPEVLPRLIERVIALREGVGTDRLLAMLAGLDRIPSPPSSFWRISEALADPVGGLDRVGQLIAEDPSVSSKLLQVVNSAYFGLGRSITSVPRAVAYLGAETVRNLVTASYVICTLETMPHLPAAVRTLFDETQRRSILVSRVAQRIRGSQAGGDAFTGGLLHDLGKLVLASSWPRELEQLQLAGPGPDTLEREKVLFGVTHAQAGAYLLGLWGIPDPIVEAVAHHHAPAADDPGGLGTTGAVHLGAALVAELLDGPAPETALDLDWVARTGGQERLADWRRLAAEEVGAAANP